MLHNLPKQEILDILLEERNSRNPRIREEIINRVSAAVLTFPRNEFNLIKLCYLVVPMLMDTRRQVRLASLECVSVLAQSLGPNNLGPLYAAINSVENNFDSEGMVMSCYLNIHIINIRVFVI